MSDTIISLEDLEGKSVTLFGQSRNFSYTEMQELLEFDTIGFEKVIGPDTALVIRGRLLNPLLEEEIDAIQKSQKIPTIEIET